MLKVLRLRPSPALHDNYELDQKWRVVYLQLESELSEVKQKMREEKEQAEEKGEEVMARMHEVTQKLEDECSRSRTIIGALQEKLSEADKVSERLKKEEEEKTYSSSSEQSRISACPTAAEQMLKVLRLRPSPALHDNYERQINIFFFLCWLL
eukprot:GHVS01026649.1.p1 GENE.GHVS01026649.1~~GHVS01026649.1.p1  ORF type:complete len:153 (-),score=29.21 GHVS01026649.1:111-569(-)